MSVVDQPFPSASRPDDAEAGSLPGQANASRTTVPSRAVPRPQQTRRQIAGVRREDVLALTGALAAALATTGVLWTQLTPFTGIFGYIVVSWFLFVLIYALLVAFDNKKPTVRDRISAVVTHSLAAVVILTLAFIVLYTVFKGAKALAHLNFYTQDLHKTLAFDPLTKGGVLQSIVGTLIELAIAIAITLPLGVAGGLLNEVGGRFARMIRTVVEAMTALPSIVAGLFIYPV